MLTAISVFGDSLLFYSNFQYLLGELDAARQKSPRRAWGKFRRRLAVERATDDIADQVRVLKRFHEVRRLPVVLA